MFASTDPCKTSPISDNLHAAFLDLLPRLQTHATIFFRDIRCPDTKADRISEMVALAWKWYCRLCEQGKDVNEFAMVFIFLVAKAVKSGRRLCGQEKAKDVLSPVAQRRQGFRVESLPTSSRCEHESLYSDVHGQRDQDTFEERLRDNVRTAVPDQVAFRVDWPRYFQTLAERDRQLAEFLSLGHSANKAAERFKLSPGRVTQLRQKWGREWQVFQDAGAVQE